MDCIGKELYRLKLSIYILLNNFNKSVKQIVGSSPTRGANRTDGRKRKPTG